MTDKECLVTVAMGDHSNPIRDGHRHTFSISGLGKSHDGLDQVHCRNRSNSFFLLPWFLFFSFPMFLICSLVLVVHHMSFKASRRRLSSKQRFQSDQPERARKSKVFHLTEMFKGVIPQLSFLYIYYLIYIYLFIFYIYISIFIYISLRVAHHSADALKREEKMLFQAGPNPNRYIYI